MDKKLITFFSCKSSLFSDLWLVYIAGGGLWYGLGFMSYTEIGSRDPSPSLFNGSFTLPDPDSDSDSHLDSKPYGYIVLFRTFYIGSDLDPDPFPLAFV